MFPVEASRELQVRIFHRLGSHQYVFTLQLQCGDDVQTRVLEPFQQGRLPSCLYRPTLEYAALAVRESLTDHEAPQPVPASSGHPAHGPAGRHSFGSAAATLGEVFLELEERQWPRLLGGACGMQAPSKATLFWCACDYLLRHRPAFFRTIGTLEDSYLKAIREKQSGRLAAISELQRCQSMDMEKVRQRSEKESKSPDVQSLVAQHVSEIDALELHWRTEIKQLKMRQKTTYCEYVVDFWDQEIKQMRSAEAAAGEEDDPEAAFPPSPAAVGEPPLEASAASLACPLREPAGLTAGETASQRLAEEAAGPRAGGVPEEPGRSEDPRGRGDSRRQAASAREGRVLECAEVRAVFGQRRVFFVLRLWVGDIMDFLHEVPAPEEGQDSWAADDGDGAGPQLPPQLLGLASYGHFYFARGSALPLAGAGWPLVRPVDAGTPATAEGHAQAGGAVAGSHGARGRGVFRSPSLRFWKSSRLPPPVHLSLNAYAEHLRALVIPTPENLKFESSQAVMVREFKNRCERVTDLHFPPLAAQLRSVSAATEQVPLRSGDYFCTRHSNLGGAVQVAFHLLVGSSEAPASDEVSAAMHRALKRIACDCHQCRIAELSLPLLLLEIGTSESSLPYAVAQRRAENALRALKGALTRLADELAPSELPSLQVLNLVLPLSCAQTINAGMPSVAETTLTFLQHSFQCV